MTNPRRVARSTPPNRSSGPRPLRGRGEGGVALATVTLACVILMTLAIASVSYALGSQTISRRDQKWNGALAAAEAGIDDYLFRLNQNSNYWKYSASLAPPDGNGAFTGWVNVPGAANPASYRYTANSTSLGQNGTIVLTSTGNVGGVTRTVQTTLRRRAFIDYLYFTDYEVKDPAAYDTSAGDNYTPAQAQTSCALHYYESRPSNCSQINFISADNINGPLHSNDATYICGTPHFNGDTSTSWVGASGKRWLANTSCSGNAPVFATAGDPRYLPPLTMPPSNSSIKAETVQATGNNGGCLFTGPTSIVLNSNGTMTVNSPFSKSITNGCTKSGTQALPKNGVIYVQNVPSSASDVNYTNGCPYSNVKLPGQSTGRSHPLGYPIDNDVTTYGCRNGDVFLEGTLKGQLTIASENNIDVVWHVGYQSGVAGTDMLGLVANNYVEVYHPVNSSGTNLYAKVSPNRIFTTPLISAALLSVNHSFRVQNYNKGGNSPSMGPLTITGAIAQRYRGTVGTNSGGTISNGYAKAYNYDTRLRYMAPPKFLDPVASAWGVATWSEIEPAY